MRVRRAVFGVRVTVNLTAASRKLPLPYRPAYRSALACVSSNPNFVAIID